MFISLSVTEGLCLASYGMMVRPGRQMLTLFGGYTEQTAESYSQERKEEKMKERKEKERKERKWGKRRKWGKNERERN